MKSIYIMGTEASGKTIVSLGLALNMQARGHRVGYIQPVDSSPLQEKDDNAKLFQQALDLPPDFQIPSSLSIGPHYLSSLRKREKYQQTISAAFNQVCNQSNELDLLLIEGATNPYLLSSQRLDDFSLARERKTPALVTISVKNDYSLDQALLINRHLEAMGVEVIGNIFNNVVRQLLDKVKGIYQPLLEKEGYRVLGTIPASPDISAPTAREFYSSLGGEILTGEEHLDKKVEDIVVGSMTIESAFKYLRRTTNKAVIIGGDRNDLALTALETNTSVIILTGGLYPNVKVISMAEEKQVPVILVHHDTYTTIEQLHSVTQQRTIQPGDKKTIELAKKNVENHCQLEPLLNYLD